MANDPAAEGPRAPHPDSEALLKQLRECVPQTLQDHPALNEVVAVLPHNPALCKLACEELKLRFTWTPNQGKPLEPEEILRRTADFLIRAFTPSEIVVAFAELKEGDQKKARALAGASAPPIDADEAFAGILRAAGLLEADDSTGTLRMAERVKVYLRTTTTVWSPKLPAGDAEKVRNDAKSILRGEVKLPSELLKLAKELKKFNEFGLARQLLARARADTARIQNEKERRELRQQHALCTYKDPDVPLATRLDRAFEILSQEESIDLSSKECTEDPETLGIAGAICKRKWQAEGQRQHLELALAYYLRGSDKLKEDYGYTAINAAFLLNCLAEQEAVLKWNDEGRKAAENRRAHARTLRESILQELPPMRLGERDVNENEKIKDNRWLNSAWWFHATLAEAALGVGRLEEAAFWMEKAKEIPVYNWEFESTAQQLAALARLHTEEVPDGGEAFLSKKPNATEGALLQTWQMWMLVARLLGSRRLAESKFIGTVGLALSGGGFRASLFHIGVLARLAELDLLRRVEVLSCVSGGSIVGAHYYLELRRLLESKADRDITRDDYVEIVRRMAQQFLAGVQRNVRTRVAASLWASLRMFWNSNDSRTHRAGELYEKEIFARAGWSGTKPPAQPPLRLFEPDEEHPDRGVYPLKIKPVQAPHDGPAPDEFNPKLHNWQREAKVPQLILNATSLNTGHNWQFTATFMGEPPGAIDPSIDGNDRLRRMYYHDAPAPHNELRLGAAVGASACVPGIFEPLPLDELYPGKTVRLVDGGVHDNQGVGGLLEQDATFLIVSDASGQMSVQPSPSSGPLAVPLRSNDILMARVRTAQAQDLRARRRAGLLRGLMFLHLKKDLDVDPIDWTGCRDVHAASDNARPASRRGPLTTYGIRKDMQEKIAALRTDLDSFSEVEAWSLMTSGYLMADREFRDQIKDLGPQPPLGDENKWEFLKIKRHLDYSAPNDAAAVALLHQLDVGNQLAFKVWRLSPLLRALTPVLGLAVAVGLLVMCVKWRTSVLLTVGGLAVTLFLVLLTSILGKRVMRVVNFRAELRRVLVSLGLCCGGFILARLHLWIFDPWFLRIGRVANLSNHHPPRPNPALRTTTSILVALVLAITWSIYQSDRVQRTILISRAPVMQALAMRDGGIASAAGWEQRLRESGQSDAEQRVRREIDAALARIPAFAAGEARQVAAASGHIEASVPAASGEESDASARSTAHRDHARALLRAARASDVHSVCLDGIAASWKIRDVAERSSAFADIATILAAAGDPLTARIVADRCEMPADRLNAYRAILGTLSPPALPGAARAECQR